MNKNEISVPLWKAISEKTATEYYRGSKNGVQIGDKIYKATLFINQNKKSDKSPDMNVVLTEINIPQNSKTNYDNNKSDIQLTNDDIDNTFNDSELKLPF